MKLADIEVTVMHETEKAWLLSPSGSKEDAAWVPKSIGEMADLDPRTKIGTVTLPEWMAIEKGLV